MDNIILIGFMGCGKSTIGKNIAKRLNMNFIDMDVEIELEQQVSIKEIFAAKGEVFFRDLETDFLKNFQKVRNVIATGGGIVLRSENVEYLKKLGTVVFLHASIDHLMGNLNGDTKRPLIEDASNQVKIEEILEKRESYYLGAADLIIQTSGKSIDAIVDEILSLIIIHSN